MCSGYNSVVLGANSISFGASTATSNSFVDGCCDAITCLGGVIWTEIFEVPSGETREVFYEYSAAAGGDWYEAAIVLYSTSNPAGTEPLRGELGTSGINQVNLRRGNTVPLGEETFDNPVGAGNYFIAFYMASYDRTNGGALGATMTVGGFGARVP